ncbi:MAG: hypothetical protein IKS32_04005 [Solobacterium sp.]|nr:hypothetical protein [Solobacterium sp.]
MYEILLIIGCLLFVFVIGYWSIGRLFDLLDTETSQKRTYRVVSDDPMVLHQMKNYFDPEQCILLAGYEQEVIDELQRHAADFAILNSGRKTLPVNADQMNHIHTAVQLSDPLYTDEDIRIYMISNQLKYIDIYYRDAMEPVIREMTGNGLIQKTDGRS